jgi:hypothetical protein
MALRYPDTAYVASALEAPYGAVGDGINDDRAAIQKSLDERNYAFLPPERIYRCEGHLRLRTNAQLFGLSPGDASNPNKIPVAKLYFVGGDGGGCLRNNNTAAALQHVSIKDLAIEAAADANYSNMMDFRHIIGLRLNFLRLHTSSLTIGGIKSTIITNLFATGNVSWVNNWTQVEVRLPQASTGRPFDLDTSDSVILGGNFTGGYGAALRGPGAVKVIGTRFDITGPGDYDETTNPTGTLGAGITIFCENPTETWTQYFELDNLQIEENLGAGILIHAKAGAAADHVMAIITNCAFRNPAGPKTDWGEFAEDVDFPPIRGDVVLLNQTGKVLRMPLINHLSHTLVPNTEVGGFPIWPNIRIAYNPEQWLGRPIGLDINRRQGNVTFLLGDIPRQPPLLLAQSAVPITRTAVSAAETVLHVTLTIPAYSLGPNDKLIFEAEWTTTGAGSKTLRNLLGFGGTVVKAVATTASSASTKTVVTARNSYTSQVAGPTNSFGGAGATAGGAVVTSAIDMTEDQFFYVQAVIATIGDSVTLESYSLIVQRHIA